MNPTCPYCGEDLVEVDNPMRREVRHRRGAEAKCPGPNAESAVAVAGTQTAEPRALASCYRCGDTWWSTSAEVRIAAEDFPRNGTPFAEPVTREHRVRVRCATCGYSPS